MGDTVKTISGGLIGGRLLGGGKGSNQTQTSVASPTYADTLKGNLSAQSQVLPQVYGLEAQYQPQFANLEAQTQANLAQQALDTAGRLYPQAANIESQYSAALDAGRLGRMQTALPQYQQAFQALSPGQAQLNQVLGQLVSSAVNNGGNLSAEELRASDQAALEGYAKRGTALGQQANLSEVLNRYNFRQQRIDSGLQRAGQAVGLQNQMNAPAIAAFFQGPSMQGLVGSAQSMGAAQSQMAGPKVTNPESSFGFQSAFLPYQAEQSRLMGQMQADATRQAGKDQMTGAAIGAAGSAAAAACWVARACFGTTTDRWKQFRNAMFRKASDKFLAFYIRNGERIANAITGNVIACMIGRTMLRGFELRWKHTTN